MTTVLLTAPPRRPPVAHRAVVSPVGLGHWTLCGKPTAGWQLSPVGVDGSVSCRRCSRCEAIAARGGRLYRGRIIPTRGAAVVLAFVMAAAGLLAGVTGHHHLDRYATPAVYRSINWGGLVHYGRVRGVTAAWTVPSEDQAGYQADWTGVDGVASTALLQAGTEDTPTGAVAWVENYPAPQEALWPVQAGDSVTVRIERTSGHSGWSVNVTDTTTGTSSTIPEQYPGPALTADWIVEDPSSTPSPPTAMPWATTPPVTIRSAGVDTRRGWQAPGWTTADRWVLRAATAVAVPYHLAGRSFTVWTAP